MSWMQRNSQKIGRCQERQCIISQILWQGQASWCWRWDKGRGCSRLPLPCALTAASWWSRAAQRATGRSSGWSEVCLLCGLDGISGGTTRMQQCGLQQCVSEVLELPKRIKSTILNFKLCAYWKEWQFGKNGLFRNQITKATRVRMKKMASGSTRSS